MAPMNALPVWLDALLAALLLGRRVLRAGRLVGAGEAVRLPAAPARPDQGDDAGGRLPCSIVSSAWFTFTRGSPSVHELLITLFLFLTAPVSAHLLVKAAMARDPSLRPEPPLTQTSKSPASASRGTR